ncbi:3'-5' exonuclease [Escherichia coli]
MKQWVLTHVLPIVSIGAVFFSPEGEELGPTFYVPVNLRSSMLNGGVADGDTHFMVVETEQGSQSQQFVLMMPLILRMHFLNYHTFITCHACNLKKLKVWGNGATFDNVILRGAYERVA